MRRCGGAWRGPQGRRRSPPATARSRSGPRSCSCRGPRPRPPARPPRGGACACPRRYSKRRIRWRAVEHRFVFLAGLHRSGTTLLARLLAAHPEISGFSGTGVPADEGQHLQSVYPAAKEYGGPGRFGFAPESHLTEASPLASEESARKLFLEWAPRWGLSRPLLLEKSPPNLLQTRVLHALLPGSAVVVIIRHPIPVSIPTARWRWTRRYDRLFEHWLRCHALFAADRVHLGPAHVLTYEQLVRDPAALLSGIFQFLGVEP